MLGRMSLRARLVLGVIVLSAAGLEACVHLVNEEGAQRGIRAGVGGDEPERGEQDDAEQQPRPQREPREHYASASSM